MAGLTPQIPKPATGSDLEPYPSIFFDSLLEKPNSALL
jgi:hypothetical protein